MLTDIAGFFQMNVKKIVTPVILLLFFITAGTGAIWVQLYLINKYKTAVDEIIINES
ncbi:hypothetical protein ACFL50_01205 [Candidatus Latescibacterota bacterium]